MVRRNEFWLFLSEFEHWLIRAKIHPSLVCSMVDTSCTRLQEEGHSELSILKQVKVTNYLTVN